MNKLIDEISAIVSKYGKDIVTEERFVNILKDLCPDRDNPEKFNIIKWCIDEGLTAEIVSNCNVVNIKKFVEKKSFLLGKQYRINAEDVKVILYSIAVGVNSITRDDYYSIDNPQKQNPPTKTKNKKKFDIDKHIKIVIYVIVLVIAYICLFATPFLYLSTVQAIWPFFTVLIVAATHFTVFSLISWLMNFFYGGFSYPRERGYEITSGAFTLVLVLQMVFVVIISFFPEPIAHFYGYDSGLYCYQFVATIVLSNFHVSSSPTFLTYLLCAAYCFFVIIAMSFVGESNNMSSFEFNKPKRFIKNRKDFVIGLIITAVVVLIGNIFFFTYPRYLVHIKDKEVEQMNIKYSQKYEQALAKSKELRKKHLSKSVDLAFKDFALGDNLDSCLNIINNKTDYKLKRIAKDSYLWDANDITKEEYSDEDDDYEVKFINSEHSGPYSLVIDSISYSQLIDSVIVVETTWDNRDVELLLYTNQNRIFALKMSTKGHISDILPIYKRKYGEPEESVRKKRVNYDFVTERYNGNYSEDYGILYYQWSFKNVVIHIKDSYYFEVFYFDRRAESLLKIHKQIQDIQLKDRLQKEDSIRRENEKAAKQRKLEEQKRKQENHKKAINQI